MKILFGAIAGIAATLAIKAHPTPIAVAVSASALGIVGTLFTQAEYRSRRRVLRVGRNQVEVTRPRLLVLKGGRKVTGFKDPLTSPWSNK